MGVVPHSQNTSLLLHFHTHFQEWFMYGSLGLPVFHCVGRVNITQVSEGCFTFLTWCLTWWILQQITDFHENLILYNTWLCIFREEDGTQRMQEMKAQYASGMQLYCQKANVVLPSSVSSTSANACGMVSKGITPVICTVIPQCFQLAFAFLSFGKNVGIYHYHHHNVICGCAYLCFVCVYLFVETPWERLNHLTSFHEFL